MTQINVTQEHIDKGLRKKPLDCPVALAVNDKLPFYLEAMVCPKDIEIRGRWFFSFFIGSRTRKNSPELRQWIVNYDSCALGVKPISFELDL